MSVRLSVRPSVRPGCVFFNSHIMVETSQKRTGKTVLMHLTHCPKLSQNLPICPKMSQSVHFRRIAVRMDLLMIYLLKNSVSQISFLNLPSPLRCGYTVAHIPMCECVSVCLSVSPSRFLSLSLSLSFYLSFSLSLFQSVSFLSLSV